MRRVVVTGMGALTPLAANTKDSWEKILKSESGIRSISSFQADDLACRIAGEVPRSTDAAFGDALFNPNAYMEPKEQRKIDTFIAYGCAAVDQAVKDAGWEPADEESRERTGVLIGSGIGGLTEIDRTSQILAASGPRRVSPFFIPSSLINLISGHAAIRYGFKGPNHAVVTACATGSHAIGDAARLIQWGDADVMIAGSSEAAVNRIAVAGFAACRALSTSYNDAPTTASRPWDKGRDGFVMGEGAGILVLEEYEHAKKRGAHIYAEILGYGLSGDAHHITAPAEDGDGAFRAMKAALRNAKLDASSIDYVNAHGTSTPLGDVVEVRAVKRLFGDHVHNIAMSSTKSAIGHLLGGAGSVEAIFSILALRDQICPPTLNLNDVEDECEGIDLVPLVGKQRKMRIAMSNSFGFGGTNASLIMGIL